MERIVKQPRALVSMQASFMLTVCLVGVAQQETVEELTDLSLTETHVLAPVGYQLNYPEGWIVTTDGPVSRILQPANGGIQIVFDARDFAFMHDLGLPEEATLADLVAFNAAFFGVSEDIEVDTTEARIFGAPALRTQLVQADGSALDALQGFTEEKVFLLYASAPTQAMLAAFQPTFEAILESLAPASD